MGVPHKWQGQKNRKSKKTLLKTQDIPKNKKNKTWFELGVIQIDDVVLADPIEPTELEPSDIFSTIEEQKKMISTWKNQIAHAVRPQ